MLDHRLVDAAARAGLQARQRGVPVHDALDRLHHVEGRADDAGILAQGVRAGHGKAGAVERPDQAILPLDRMRRGQQRAEGLAPQDIGAARRLQPIGRVRLAALELAQRERPAEPRDVIGHPRAERGLVDPMARIDRLGAGKRSLGRRAHASGPALVWRREFQPRDRAVVDLVRPVGEAQRAHVRVGAGEIEIVGDAAAAMRLDRVVDDLERHARRGDLDHRDLELGGLRADLVHHVGGLQAEQPRHLDVDAGLGDPLLPDRMVGDALAEGRAREQAPGHRLQSGLGHADRAHAMVDAAGPEPALRDLEAAALAEDQVLGRHAHVAQDHLAVAVRRVVIAEHRQHPLDLDARRVERHEDLRLLLVARRVGIGLAHHDRDLAAPIARRRSTTTCGR